MHRRPAGARRTQREPGRRLCHPGLTIDNEASLSAGVAALQRLDPDVVNRLLAVGGPPPMRRREAGFPGLAAIIVSQQVSVASASAILGKLEAQFAPLTPERLAKAADADLRACGLSAPKIRAMRSASDEIAAGRLALDRLHALDAEEAHHALLAIKGVGPWTADIFLLFCLGHPDAFPSGDLALQEAARLALALRSRPDAARLEQIAERWRPWRGVAAHMLWAYYRAVKARAGMAPCDRSG